MKIYAIGYEQIDGEFSFYVYTCKFLSERREIDKSLYYEMKPRFTLAHKNNKTMSGMYFSAEEVIKEDHPRARHQLIVRKDRRAYKSPNPPIMSEQLNIQLLRLITSISHNANAHDDDMADTWETVLKEWRITQSQVNKYIQENS